MQGVRHAKHRINIPNSYMIVKNNCMIFDHFLSLIEIAGQDRFSPASIGEDLETKAWRVGQPENFIHDDSWPVALCVKPSRHHATTSPAPRRIDPLLEPAPAPHRLRMSSRSLLTTPIPPVIRYSNWKTFQLTASLRTLVRKCENASVRRKCSLSGSASVKTFSAFRFRERSGGCDSATGSRESSSGV